MKAIQIPSFFIPLIFLPLLVCSQAVLKGPLVMTPEVPVAGEEITFEVSLEVQGNFASPVTVVSGIDGKTVLNQNITDLAQNAKQTVKFVWKATNGEHRVFFRIQESRSIPAKNNPNLPRLTRSNSTRSAATIDRVFQVGTLQMPVAKLNTTYQRMTVSQKVCEDPPLPDLVVTVRDNVSGSGFVGDPVNITVDVVNAGQCLSLPCKLKLFVNTSSDGDLVGEITVPSLEPQRDNSNSNCSFSHSFNYLVTSEANFQFHAVLDKENQVEEFRKYNNDDYGGEFYSKRK